MGARTPIEWADDTVNPTSGCDGCELARPGHMDEATCYALKVHLNRLSKAPALRASGHYAPTFFEVRTIAGRLAEAAKRKDLRGTWRDGKPWLDGLPRCIFVGDLSDVMSAAVSEEFVETEIFAPMESEKGRRHIWMLLTKRPHRLAQISARRPGGLPGNCVAMTSITNQRTAETRVRGLDAVHARWKGLSVEPMHGAIDLAYACFNGADSFGSFPGIQWVIMGGESGPNARPTCVNWIRDLVAQCRRAKVATFVKQLGSRPYEEQAGGPLNLYLADPKGGDWDEWPQELRVREMPNFLFGEVRS